jgi:hypothetical protein
VKGKLYAVIAAYSELSVSLILESKVLQRNEYAKIAFVKI